MLSVDQIVTLAEILALIISVAVTWAIYYESDRAELPGEAPNPDSSLRDDMRPPVGRTL
jgi:hypothetical protein